MRRKTQCNGIACRIAQLLLDLRCMTVSCHAICLDIFIDFTEQVWNFCPSACTGRTGLGINDDAIAVNQSFLYQRINGQDRTGGITAWICHNSGTRYFVTIDLAQSIYCFFDKLWTLVGDTIPLLVYRDIFDSEIRT